MNHSEKPSIQVEISFDRENRYGENYRPHFVPVEFPHLMLGVQFDCLPQMPIKEKFTATARLLYDIDYSTLMIGTDFWIKEGPHTVGSGKVLTVGGCDLLDYPMFCEYLSNKRSGNRKQALSALHCFIIDLKKENRLLTLFCVQLCKVLDSLHYVQGEYNTIDCGHWFNQALKKLLYDFFAPLIENRDCSFEYQKWFCLYARDFNIENNRRIDLCGQLMAQCGYRDQALVSYYINDWLSRLNYAIHELPLAYLGDEDPGKDLEVLDELRKIAKICYGTDERFSNIFSIIEKEIRGYMKAIKQRP